MTTELHISDLEDDGLVVVLDDGTVWDVRPGDISKTATWYPTMRIVVEASSNDVYGNVLLNLDTAAPDRVQVNRRNRPDGGGE